MCVCVCICVRSDLSDIIFHQRFFIFSRANLVSGFAFIFIFQIRFFTHCSDWPHTLKSELVTKGDALTHKDPQLHTFLFFFFTSFEKIPGKMFSLRVSESESVVKKILHRKWNVSPTCKTVPLSVSLCRAKGRPKAHDAPRLHTTDPQSLSWAACTLVCLFVCFDGDHADKWCDVHLTFFSCFPLWLTIKSSTLCLSYWIFFSP